MAGQLSVALPLAVSLDETGGFVSIYDYEKLIAQNLKNLILTCPGEKPMYPEFGVGLRTFLFLQNVPVTLDSIGYKIREQIAYYMSYIEVLGVNVVSGEANFSSNSSTDTEPNMIKVELFYRIIPLDLQSYLTLSVSR